MKLFGKIKAWFSGRRSRPQTAVAGVDERQAMEVEDIDAMCRQIAAEDKVIAEVKRQCDRTFYELCGLQVRIFRAIRAKEYRLAASLMRRESILLFGHVTAAVELDIEAMKSGQAIHRFTDILPDENTTGGVAVEE